MPYADSKPGEAKLIKATMILLIKNVITQQAFSKKGIFISA
jgi:hypothetical protein